MKIAVFTHCDSDDNYGQILQCYALQKYLLMKGHDAYLVDYQKEASTKSESFHFLKAIVRRLLTLLIPSRRASHKKIQGYQLLRKRNKDLNIARGFAEFKRNHIRLTRTYTDYREVLSNPPVADAYIVGSDQVWNPSVNHPSAAVWYLAMGDRNTLRIAYAASIGRRIEVDEADKFKEFLKGLDAIGMREESGLRECMSVGVSNAELVLDPTLLVDDSVYGEVMLPQSGRREYLMLYYLNVEGKEEIAWDEISDYLRGKDLELLPVCSSGYLPASDFVPGHEGKRLTIPEWLGYMWSASAVVTTSFHGVVFAIIAHRKFVWIPLKGRYEGGNARVETLLSLLDLSQHAYNGKGSLCRILNLDVDWNGVDGRLNKLRHTSQSFLKDALARKVSE